MSNAALTPLDVHAFVASTLRRSGQSDGTLADLTFVAKDMFAIEGHTSSFGHPAWRTSHEPSRTDAPVIELLLTAGADLIGLTKMDQLAYSLIGDVGEGQPPINTRAPDLFCGGSSSGSASAVAAGLADVGLGTDTAGSIRVPAAVCGVHGIRPTHGAIDSSGVLPLAPSLDAVGLLGRSVVSLARALRMLAPDSHDQTPVHSVMFARDVFGDIDDETSMAARTVADRLAANYGVEPQDADIASYTSADVGDLFARIQSREIWRTIGPWVLEHGHHLADDVQQRLRRCEELDGDNEATKEADLKQRAVYCHELQEMVRPGSMLVLPVLPHRGPLISWNLQQLVDFRRECFRLSAPSSLGGGPQAVYSIPNTADTRSMGVGLLTAPGGEDLLLDAMSLLDATGQRP